MECHEVNELLSAYADGMLAEEEASGVREHLDRCAECLDTYESMSRIIEQMHRMEAVEEPEDFVDRVRERLEKRSAVTEFARRLFVPVKVKLPLEVAALAAVLVLVFYLAGIREHEAVYDITIAMGARPRQEAVEKMTEGGTVEKMTEDRAIERMAQERAAGKMMEDRAVEMTTEEKSAAPKHMKKGREKGVPPLQAALQSAGARVIKSEYREDATPSSMTVEIRADKYQLLLQELGRLGLIQRSQPEVQEAGNELIRVRITFQ